ncbi:MAG: hypothetical protein OJF48_003350 [Afipia sp.]|nr:MAG: hypothetical protein OJF48_003350 [Afipia sp.]
MFARSLLLKAIVTHLMVDDHLTRELGYAHFQSYRRNEWLLQ